jgi:hypothetical protein
MTGASDRVQVVGTELIPHQPEDIVRMEHASMAMKLRADGNSYQEIADQLSISMYVARRLVQEGLRHAISEPAEEVRQLEAFKLERLYKVVYPLALAGDGAAVDRCIKIMERKSKLLGLDSPTEVDMAELRSVLFAKLKERLPHDVWMEVVKHLADGA